MPVTVPAKHVFARAVCVHLSGNGREPPQTGSAHYGQLANCWVECDAACRRQTGIDPKAEAYPADLVSTDANEFYTLNPLYKQARVDALATALSRELLHKELPSDRVWGRLERTLRVYGRWKRVDMDKIQNAFGQKPLDERTLLRAQKEGRWILPPLQEKLPGTETELEEHVWLLERGMFLANFATMWESIVTFHRRFWLKVRASHSPPPGHRALTVSEIIWSYQKYQDYWEAMSRRILLQRQSRHEPQDFDEMIRERMPPDEFDLLELRLNLRPRLSGPGGSAPTSRDSTAASATPKGGRVGKGKGGHPNPQLSSMPRTPSQEARPHARDQARSHEEQRLGRQRATHHPNAAT